MPATGWIINPNTNIKKNIGKYNKGAARTRWPEDPENGTHFFTSGKGKAQGKDRGKSASQQNATDIQPHLAEIGKTRQTTNGLDTA